jgi:hypothetical protein
MLHFTSSSLKTSTPKQFYATLCKLAINFIYAPLVMTWIGFRGKLNGTKLFSKFIITELN